MLILGPRLAALALIPILLGAIFTEPGPAGLLLQQRKWPLGIPSFLNREPHRSCPAGDGSFTLKPSVERTTS